MQQTTTAADYFPEAPRFQALLSQVLTATSAALPHEERAMIVAQLTDMLQLYQEQPHLLDRHLEGFFLQLVAVVRDGYNGDVAVLHSAMQLMYHLAKVRGPKVVVRFFSHDVTDLEPLLALLTQQHKADGTTWHARYVLLLWLSIVCMIPFSFRAIDSSGRDDGLVLDLIAQAQQYLGVASKEREAASLLLARLLIRRDVLAVHLPRFIDWSFSTIESGQIASVTGVLQTLATILKIGERNDLVPVIEQSNLTRRLLDSEKLCIFAQHHAVIRKLQTKVIQRIGLVYLRPRVASWRYQQGRRSMAENLAKATPLDNTGHIAGSSPAETVDDADYPDTVPDIIEELVDLSLRRLEDKDTVVRWSAAKGLGRLAERLYRDMASDIVTVCLETMVSKQHDPTCWHGSCLMLAEFARRGLLLPTQLSSVFPVVFKALQYDQRQGSSSVGANVRDAACYVSWAFARAYDPLVMSAHLVDLARSLVLAMLFDREIQCRRAASAAFQEVVGRQGSFPHGIDIIAVADYFAVGQRVFAFQRLSLIIARYNDYLAPMLNHLLHVKLGHWDPEIRVLAATTLGWLAPLDRSFSVDTLVQHLLRVLRERVDVNQCHGALVALGVAVFALSFPNDQVTQWALSDAPAHDMHLSATVASFTGINHKELRCHTVTVSMEPSRHTLVDTFKHSLLQELGQVALQVRSLLHGGAHSGLLRTAYAIYVGHLALAQTPLHSDSDIVNDISSTLLENLGQVTFGDPSTEDLSVISLHLNAWSTWMAEYKVSSRASPFTEEQRRALVVRLLGSHEAIFPLIVGALPLALLDEQTMRDAWHTFKTAVVTKSTSIEHRRGCLMAIDRFLAQGTSLVDIVGASDIFEAAMECLNDYTTDRRGDVGSWVRMAAMDLLDRLVASGAMHDHAPILQMCSKLLEQCLSRISRVRTMAASSLQRLVSIIPALHPALTKAFSSGDLNVHQEDQLVPVIMNLAVVRPFAADIIVGTAVAIAGLSDSLAKCTTASLLNLMASLPVKDGDLQTLEDMLEVILAQLTRYGHDDRVMPCLLSMLVLLWDEQDIIEQSNAEFRASFVQQLNGIIKMGIHRCCNIGKLEACVQLLCHILSTVDLERSTIEASLHLLLLLLCYPFATIRRFTAEQTYMAITVAGETIFKGQKDAQAQGEIEAILSETPWDTRSVDAVRPMRDQLYGLFGLRKPDLVVVVAKK